MNATRRGWLIAALAVAVLALVGSVAAVAAVARHSAGASTSAGFNGAPNGSANGYGPGMMAGGYRSGMMGGGSGPAIMGGFGAAGAWQTSGRYGLPGTGQAVTTMAAARARAQAFADHLGGGLRAGEVMQFSNGYYAELLTAQGSGATEVLIDAGTGAVSIEYGPAMMWNTRYGMHPTGDVAARVSAEQAVTDAQAWLDTQHTGLSADEVTTFPGYCTLHTLKDGKIVGMMSINSVTGAAWYHGWHGTFIAMLGE